jgi:hypothetical protein
MNQNGQVILAGSLLFGVLFGSGWYLYNVFNKAETNDYGFAYAYPNNEYMGGNKNKSRKHNKHNGKNTKRNRK